MLAAHISTAWSTLVDTVEHVVVMANRSLVHLQGTAKQALVAAASHVAAGGAVQLWDAMVACQPDPYGAVTP